jgi:DEAD/DEAH box helicase domain-containing protein
LVHVQRLLARPAVCVEWPSWADVEVVAGFARVGVDRPWAHQVEAAEHARAGQSVVVSTGTASGKSLAFLLPALTSVREGAGARGSTVLYLSPTKALAGDQLRALRELEIPGLRAATYDGDTPDQERDWVRAHAAYVLTNPDMLHRSLLPGHARWAPFWRSLSHVVVDECHVYRGVFGSHVAAVLRRLRRVARRYGADPVFVLASATVANPEVSARALVGRPVATVTLDASPRGEGVIALWEPPLTSQRGENGAPQRRSTLAETADLLTDLVLEGARSLAFVRSRRGAETVAQLAREHLSEVDPGLAGRVAAYRGGYLPEERRALEADLVSGRLLGVATTSALELGIDVSGLDAVLLAGWPGTLASLWQQVGRAGRGAEGALAVLVARDDPLDTYLVHHPEAVFGRPVEAAVLDPENPYVLGPHLAAAAAELPLVEDELADFGPGARGLVDDLVSRGLLRRRPAGWFWTRAERAGDLADLRGTGGAPVQVVESTTGRLLGTVDAGSADRSVHTGAVYVHQGEVYLVDMLDLADRVALVHAERPDWSTSARVITDIRVVTERSSCSWGASRLVLGDVDVTSQVVSFLRKRLITGEVLSEERLDLPPRTLRTRAVWWTWSAEQVAGLDLADLPGALHAAEHASIGLLPLVATCDRWDIGGVSTDMHPDTGLATVFVHDGHPGGAGFAERGWAEAATWLSATRQAIAACGCSAGCPSCVQSPKCGNGNDPLDKAGAVALLDALLAGAPAPPSLADHPVHRGTPSRC